MYNYHLKVTWTKKDTGQITYGGIFISAYSVEGAIGKAREYWPEYEIDTTEAIQTDKK